MTAFEDGLLSTAELIADTSISYRQIDYWMRNGVLFPAHWEYLEGSGGRRRFTPGDRKRILALEAHLQWLRAQHLEPTVEHLRQWWETTAVLNG